MRNFNRFIGIDWTGAKSPIQSKSIAIAECVRGQSAPNLLNQKWSRQLVSDYIETLLNPSSCGLTTGSQPNQKDSAIKPVLAPDRVLQDDERILIGIDCNFGYASEILEKQIGKSKTAFDLWAEVEKVCKATPNFFAGNFWEHPNYQSYFWTSGKMPHEFQMPQRQTEIQCSAQGYGHPESPFKMIGAKQVGKGGLSGMRVAHYLKQKHGDKIAIWPFDTLEICNQATVVIVEIYPRQFIKRAGFGNQKIRNTNNINSILSIFKSNLFNQNFNSDHDSDAIISAAGLRYLCGDNETLPHGLSKPNCSRKILLSEGWIFGVGFGV